MKRELDFSGREQLYYQIYDIMYQDIVGGKYQIGDLLPAESELMSYYKVSRATVRKAMGMLDNEGLIEKKRGHGTYVKSLKAKSEDQRIVSFLREHNGDERVASKKVVEQVVKAAGEEISKELKLSKDTQVIKLKRVRYAGDKPMYIETNYIAYDWAPEVMERDFSKESLRVYYVNHCNAKLAKAEEEIYSILAEGENAKLLQVEEGTPLFYIKRTSYDEHNIAREFVKAYYRADTYHMSIKLEL